MKTKTPIFVSLLIASALITSLFSCQKEPAAGSDNGIPTGMNQVNIMLTDDPSMIYDSIFIDIRKLEVKVEEASGAEHWDVLNIRTGVYNILRFRNGLDTLLASGYVPGGEVKKIRITLGTGNYVMLNGVAIPVDLNSSDAVVTIDVNGGLDNIGVRRFRIWLDMDGHGSVRIKSNGRLELKLRVSHFCHGNSGEIEGEIKPSAAFPVMVTAIAGTDTLIAIPGREGEFRIRGIKSNTATLIIKPSNGYKDSVITNIPVRTGEDTQLGRIVLHQ